MWPTATIPLHPFPSPTCRHRGGMLRIWGHWCSEGSPEGRAELLHRSHAHQGNYHFSLSQPRVCTLMLNDVTLPCLQSWTKETLVFHVVFKPKELPVVTCCFSCIFFGGGRRLRAVGVNAWWSVNKTLPWQINLIAPPRYVMTTTTLERTEGLSVLNQAMAAIKERIEEKRGVFNIQMEVSDFCFSVQTSNNESLFRFFITVFFQ